MLLALLGAVLLGPTARAADAPKPGRVVLESKGYLVPASRVTVSHKVPGQVIEVRFEEGKKVAAGDVLARLDPAEQEEALRLARAKLKLAEARLAKAKQDGGQVGLAVAQAKVGVAQALVATARQRLDCTVIRAPVGGTVLTKRAEVGTMLSPNAFPVAASLCDLADLKTMEVEVWLQERDLAKVAQGQPCQVRLEAFPDVTYRGCVARLLPVADRAKGAVGVRVRLDLPAGDDRPRPEMGALVAFLAKD
jgi:multidrug resistance efflux pump